MLVSQKFGVHESVTACNASTLEQAEYRIKTELGLAPNGYKHTPQQPIYGTGQGSANSPAIWCFLSSTMFDCYDKVVKPATYTSPAPAHLTVTLGMIGFVDDCNGQTNSFEADGSSNTVCHLVRKAQRNAQNWNDILSASGGALELSKTSCHVVQWIFAANGAPVLAPFNPKYTDVLQVRDRQKECTHSLEILSAYKAHKTLGHYKDPAGTQQEQYRQLKKRSDDTSSFLWKCPLTRLEAWTYYYACYLPRVSYPLSCSSLSRHQLDVIQRQAMKIIVARCGFNRNTRKEILYGPLALGGSSFRHLYVQQGINQTMMFIRHWRQDSTAGRLLRIAIAWFQEQTGVSFSILHDVHSKLPQLESKWIQSLRQFMSSINVRLQLDEPTIPKVQRLYDVYLMEAIQNSRQFTDAEVKRLNYCRLFLKAVTLSDISHTTGTRLDMSKLEGRPSLTSSVTHGPTIYQETPSAAEWTLWKRANRLWSDTSGTLHEPLGPWILHTSEQRQQHQAYWGRHTVEELDASIWVRVDDGYLRCEPISDVWHYQETTHLIPWERIPDATFPVEVHSINPGQWKMTYTGNVYIPTHPSPSTFGMFLQLLPLWESELLHSVEMECDAFTVSEALSHGLRAVSDGSVWDEHSGSVWLGHQHGYRRTSCKRNGPRQRSHT